LFWHDILIRSVEIWMGFMLILFNVKLFTRYFSVASKDMQAQEKCRFIKTVVKGISCVM